MLKKLNLSLILLCIFCLEFIFHLIQIPWIEQHLFDYKNNIGHADLIVSGKYDIELEELLSTFSLITVESVKFWRDPKVFRLLNTGEIQEYTGIIRSKSEFATIEHYYPLDKKVYQIRIYPYIFPG